MSVRKGEALLATGEAAAFWNFRVLGVCAVLGALVFLVFGQSLNHGFLNWDDNEYVYDNPMISRGLSLDGIRWAFTHIHSGNWHPLTSFSHMLDCQFYGLDPWGHHFTNLWIHALTAVALFLMLREMTGGLWRSAFAAALFAVHPLRVESVVWVAERKDLLSGLFFMLTLWAYVRYQRAPASLGRYGLVLVSFVLGLMSKPMLVTIPGVLLLLDYWPLRRALPLSQLLKEKIPLFLLSVLSCFATLMAQAGAIQPLSGLPLSLRIGNALVVYWIYLGKLIYPVGLAALYPLLKNGWPIGLEIAAALLLIGACSGVFLVRQKKPYLLVGWLWYLGMLVPVLGILQVGQQAYADRYTYLPQIGLYIAGTWVAADWVGISRTRRWVLGNIGALILLVFSGAAYHQAGYWSDNETLWRHTLECTIENSSAQTNLGSALLRQGKTGEAIVHYREALRINPSFVAAHDNIGSALFKQGKVDEAVAHYHEALRVNPGYANAHYNLGNALFKQGLTEDAIIQYREAIRINPMDAQSFDNCGTALMKQGREEESLAQFKEAVRINPSNVDAHYNLGSALIKAGQVEAGILQMKKALELQPDDVDLQKLNRELEVYKASRRQPQINTDETRIKAER